MIRVAFLGNDRWSVPTLRALDEAHDVEVTLVVTNPPRPAGRGSEPRATSVAVEARGRGLPLLEVAGVRSGEGLEALRRGDADAFVVVAYGELLLAEVLDLPRLGSVNVHFSVLPRWRGAAPVQRAILEGDERTGVTVMVMDEGMDTGPILATVEVPIVDDEDAGALGARLAELGAPLLVESLRRFEAGAIAPRPQEHGAATYAPKLTAADRPIEWSSRSDTIVRRVRALAPAPGALTTFRGLPLKILRAVDRGPRGYVVADHEHTLAEIHVMPG
ncbi:MAG TPA: methionyl-tRNA formyltransferase, partial [Actinomycetota bacterium]|nr:methionyl-tRNA formyltransferase [Actinomycetota bacterium]